MHKRHKSMSSTKLDGWRVVGVIAFGPYLSPSCQEDVRQHFFVRQEGFLHFTVYGSIPRRQVPLGKVNRYSIRPTCHGVAALIHPVMNPITTQNVAAVSTPLLCFGSQFRFTVRLQLTVLARI